MPRHGDRLPHMATTCLIWQVGPHNAPGARVEATQARLAGAISAYLRRSRVTSAISRRVSQMAPEPAWAGGKMLRLLCGLLSHEREGGLHWLLTKHLKYATCPLAMAAT